MPDGVLQGKSIGDAAVEGKLKKLLAKSESVAHLYVPYRTEQTTSSSAPPNRYWPGVCVCADCAFSMLR